MRLFVQGSAAVRVDDLLPAGRIVQLLDVRRHIEEAFGSEEVAGARPARAANESEVLVKLRMRRPCREPRVLASALGVESCRDSDRLDQR